jgi:CBS-domain-containing membrane protein
MAKRQKLEEGSSVSFTTSQAFLHELIHTKAEALIPPDGRIFIAQRSDKVIDVWKGLIAHNFLSVPVLQKTGSKYYGLLDLADIVLFVVKTFGSKLNVDKNFWEMDISQEHFFQSRTVKDIMTYPLSRRNPFHPISKGYSLFSAVEALARQKGLHRVPVVDSNRQLANILTQSQVLDFVAEHLNILGSIKDLPAREMLSPDVLTIGEDELALGAFHKMVEHNISGLAVVDNQGKIVESISVRDLKAIQYDGRMFWRLNQKVKDFLMKIKKDREEKKKRPKDLVVGKLDEPLEQIIAKLHGNRVHRLFVVNEQSKPVGVISLKDILLQIISRPSS